MVTYCTSQAQADAEMAEWLKTAPGTSMPNNYGNQCSAAMQHYSVALFGRPWSETLGYGNAINHIDNASDAFFEKVWNDPTNANLLPRPGDIAVYKGAAPLWGGQYYGHTGAVDSFNAYQQTLVQQDGAAQPARLFPDGNYYSVKPAHKGTFQYVGDSAVGDVRGWLRPRWGKVVYSGADKRGYGATSTVVNPGSTSGKVQTPAPGRVRNGVDISAYQPGNLPVLVSADFVIVKATEGAGWVNPNLREQVATARAKGARVGLYHFATAQASSDAEAAYFVKTVRPYLNAETAVVLDWEPAGLATYTGWAEDWLRAVDKATGRTTVVYMNLTVSGLGTWTMFAKKHPLWLAYYGNDTRFDGYATTATPPAVPGWQLALWQYTQHGRLPGYAGDLDLNIYLGGVSAWDKSLGAAAATTTITDPLEEIMSWYKNKADFEHAMAMAVLGYKNPKVNGGRDVYALLTEAATSTRSLIGLVKGIPASILQAKVTRKGTGAAGTVTQAEALAYEKANWSEGRANQQKIIEQQGQIIALLTEKKEV